MLVAEPVSGLTTTEVTARHTRDGLNELPRSGGTIIGWTGVRLWRRDQSVIAVAGVLLFNLATLGIAILAMGISQLARGTPVDAGLLVIFVALTALALAALTQYVGAIRSSALPIPVGG